MEKEFFDNALDKAKGAFEIAKKKTEEVYNTSKLNINLQTLKSKREKLYASLGKNYFDSIQNSEELNDENKDIFNQISALNEEINELKLQINSIKNKRVCPNCGSSIAENATFCSSCGAKLVFDSEENEE